MAAQERVVKHAVFTYTDRDGVYRTELRGERISIDGAELARGERFDVFFEDEDVDVSAPLDGALVGNDEDLVDEEAVAAAALAAALAAASSPPGAQPTPLDNDAAAVAAAGVDELSGTGVVEGSGSELERPRLTANKAAWLAYRGLGDLTEEQANAVTLKELQDDVFMASYQRPTA